jgi:hypothetical protein
MGRASYDRYSRQVEILGAWGILSYWRFATGLDMNKLTEEEITELHRITYKLMELRKADDERITQQYKKLS